MEVRYYEGSTNVEEGCKVVLGSRLYSKGGWMRDWAKSGSKLVDSVAVAFVDGNAVGAAMTCHCEEIHGVFVKRKHRRQGIGSALFKKVERSDYSVYCTPGVRWKFFNSLGW